MRPFSWGVGVLIRAIICAPVMFWMFVLTIVSFLINSRFKFFPYPPSPQYLWMGSIHCGLLAWMLIFNYPPAHDGWGIVVGIGSMMGFACSVLMSVCRTG